LDWGKLTGDQEERSILVLVIMSGSATNTTQSSVSLSSLLYKRIK